MAASDSEPQSSLRPPRATRPPQRKGDHLVGGPPQSHRLRHRQGVERIQDQRHTLALERLPVLAELNLVRTRNLLDEADDFHSGETNGRRSGSCTTSTATSMRSTKCSPKLRPQQPIAGCSAATMAWG